MLSFNARRQSDALIYAGIHPDHAHPIFQLLKPANRSRVTRPSRGDLVVLDEISQIGTKRLLHLLRIQRQRGFSIIAIGDDKQNQSMRPAARSGCCGARSHRSEFPKSPARSASCASATARPRCCSATARQPKASGDCRKTDTPCSCPADIGRRSRRRRSCGSSGTPQTRTGPTTG